MSNENNENQKDTPFKEKVEMWILAGSIALLGASWALMFIPTLANSWKYQNTNH